MSGEGGTDVLRRELERVVDRVRHLSLARLAEPAPPWGSRADAARAVAQRLADLAQDLEEAGGGAARRAVPRLHDAAAGDQLAVTGHDLLLAAEDAPPSVVREAIDALVELRHAM